MYQGSSGPYGTMFYLPSPPTFDINPDVTFTDSIPNEGVAWHPMAQTGFGWYTDVREYNLWFDVNQ
jgi:hypothetical protein